MAITATTPTNIPASTYSTYWIQSININNKNPSQPIAFVVFALGDISGNLAPNVPTITYRLDIMAKITAGNSALATLFQSVVDTAGTLAIADGVLPATVA
jgi:hypothetical protein